MSNSLVGIRETSGQIVTAGNGLGLGASAAVGNLGGNPPGKMTVVTSGIVPYGLCCVGATAGSYKYSSGSLNKAFCPHRVGYLSWLQDDAADVTVNFGGGCASTRSVTVRTWVEYCNNTWTMIRHGFDGSGNDRMLLFYGTVTGDHCFPLTINNSLTTCLEMIPDVSDTTRFYISIVSGGSATLSFDGCAIETLNADPAPSTARDTASIRTCCNVFDVTIGGGTEFDGRYRLVKSGAVGTASWQCQSFGGRTVLLFKSGTWQLFAADRNWKTGGAIRNATWDGGGSAACPEPFGPWSLSSSTGVSGTPAISVVTARDCPR